MKKSIIAIAAVLLIMGSGSAFAGSKTGTVLNTITAGNTTGTASGLNANANAAGVKIQNSDVGQVTNIVGAVGDPVGNLTSIADGDNATAVAGGIHLINIDENTTNFYNSVSAGNITTIASVDGAVAVAGGILAIAPTSVLGDQKNIVTGSDDIIATADGNNSQAIVNGIVNGSKF